MSTNLTTRETWLATVADRLRPIFAELGHPLPERLRVAVAGDGIYIGTVGGSTQLTAQLIAKGHGVMGYCTQPNPETGEVFITISVRTKDPAETLVHELVHAALPTVAGHGPEFAKLAGKMGLRRPWTRTTAGPRFNALMQPILDDLGPWPTAAPPLNRTQLPAVLEGIATSIREKIAIFRAEMNVLYKEVKTGARRVEEEVPTELTKVLTDTGRLLLAARDHIGSDGDWMEWCLQNVPVSYPFASKMMEMATDDEARA